MTDQITMHDSGVYTAIMENTDLILRFDINPGHQSWVSVNEIWWDDIAAVDDLAPVRYQLRGIGRCETGQPISIDAPGLQISGTVALVMQDDTEWIPWDLTETSLSLFE